MDILSFETLKEAKEQADVAVRFSGFPVWWVGVYLNLGNMWYDISIKGFEYGEQIGVDGAHIENCLAACRWGTETWWTLVVVVP